MCVMALNIKLTRLLILLQEHLKWICFLFIQRESQIRGGMWDVRQSSQHVQDGKKLDWYVTDLVHIITLDYSKSLSSCSNLMLYIMVCLLVCSCRKRVLPGSQATHAATEQTRFSHQLCWCRKCFQKSWSTGWGLTSCLSSYLTSSFIFYY